MEGIIIKADGSCKPNPGRMGIGIVIYQDGKVRKEISEYIGYGTNNIAEYQAVIRGLKELGKWEGMEWETKKIIIYSDSRLLVNQINGEYKVRNNNIRILFIELRKLIEEAKAEIIIKWVKRDDNNIADSLAKITI